MIVLGLTGSIGMGKSTTAGFFREAGVPVQDADQEVHRLYAGKAASAVEQLFPGTVVDGVVDRDRLAARVTGDRDALSRLEQTIHPLVKEMRQEFLLRCRAWGHHVAVLDIPLLFEKGIDAECHAVIVVTAPASVQRERVLARPDATPERLEALLARQMPDAEKRRRAHFLVDSSLGFASARRQVHAILRALALMN